TKITKRKRPLYGSETTHHPHPQTQGRGQASGEFHRVTAAIARRETPGPIPNPEAKPLSADGTAWETTWESRTPPNTHSGMGRNTSCGPYLFLGCPRQKESDERPHRRIRRRRS